MKRPCWLSSTGCDRPRRNRRRPHLPPAEALGLRRRAVPAAQSDSESDPEEEPPQNEADSLQRELETMTARTKASSLASTRSCASSRRRWNDWTTRRPKIKNAVSKERTALDARAAARTRTLLQALAALVAVVAFSWGRMFIAVFPKHRWS